MPYKIAVASTDGKVVNQHFGRAEQFYIVKVDSKGGYEPIELRKLQPVCHGYDHDAAAMKRSVTALSDCKYVLVSKIGQEAENALEKQGIGAYVIPDLIDNAVKKLIAYIQINKLIDDIIKQNTE